MTEQTPADAYIESCLIDLSKQLTAAQNRIKALEAAIFDWSNAITDWIGNDFVEQIEDEASRKLVKDVLDRAALEEQKNG